jgi:hypothetical protein
MCALLAIVQYEVLCFQDGRWTLQSRYPSDERQLAINDAVNIEQSTRRPTKVVKDTYLPDENRSETVTVYMGPLLKAAMARVKAQSAAPAARSTRHATGEGPSRRPERGLAPQAADLFWRSVIAMGLSLGAATVVTAMMSWVMSRLPDFGIMLDPSRTSAILTLTYIGVFLFGVFSLFRFGRPIKHLILALWRGPTPQAQPPLAAEAMARAPFRLKPKRASTTREQHLQDIAEMKRRRGDLDAILPDAAEVTIIDEIAPTSAPPPPPLPEAPPQTPQAQAQPAAPAQPEPSAAEKPSSPASLEPAPASAATPPPPAAPMVPPVTSFNPAISELERNLAMRFVAEVMLPQIAREADDPVARRGAALFLTGAMAHLAAVSNLNPLLAMSLISSALAAALPRQAVDAFLMQYESHLNAAGNQGVMDDGHHAMARFLAGQKNDGALMLSLQAWRTRLPPLPVSPAVEAAAADAPTDYYLLTEIRHGDAFAMDYHNYAVRQAIETADGREIKHTGRGILARFAHADFAIQAALAITAKLTAPAGLPEQVFVAVALVAGCGTADDPLLTANVTSAAQAALAAAPRGAVVCQPAVVEHAHATEDKETASFNAAWLSEKTPALSGASSPQPVAS